MSALRQKFQQDLELAGLAPRTSEAYQRAVRQLSEYYHESPSALSEAQVRDFFSHLKNERHFAPGSLKIAYSAIKFFFRLTVPREWKTLAELRAPRQSKLPVVLTREEVGRIISATRSEQNRTCFWTIYSLGLRLSEALSLQVSDIDAARSLVHIKCGKGSVDRYVPLPGSTLEALRRYWSTHRNPRFIFPALGRSRSEGRSASEAVARATIQGALRRVLGELDLKKRVSVHTLRHSYATHLLEAGVNLRLIQRFLGHKTLQATTIYLHLTRSGHEHAHAKIDALMAHPPFHPPTGGEKESERVS